jgi:hypothetical protein
LKIIRRLLDQLDLRVDDLATRLGDDAMNTTPTTKPTDTTVAVDEAFFLELAHRGVGIVTCRRKPGQPGVVQVDNGEPFEVTSRQADVLEELQNVVSRAADTFPAWTDYRSLAMRVTRASGRAMATHMAVVTVSRLRKQFREAGYSPALIERRRGRGVRLRISATKK